MGSGMYIRDRGKGGGKGKTGKGLNMGEGFEPEMVDEGERWFFGGLNALLREEPRAVPTQNSIAALSVEQEEPRAVPTQNLSQLHI